MSPVLVDRRNSYAEQLFRFLLSQAAVDTATRLIVTELPRQLKRLAKDCVCEIRGANTATGVGERTGDLLLRINDCRYWGSVAQAHKSLLPPPGHANNLAVGPK